ncbi:hypothetical protein ACWGKF_10850, partial [Streptomyces chartreusis]
MSEEPAVFRCHVVAENAEALREFVHETRPDVGCRAGARGSPARVGRALYLPTDPNHPARAGRSAPLVDIT